MNAPVCRARGKYICSSTLPLLPENIESALAARLQWAARVLVTFGHKFPRRKRDIICRRIKLTAIVVNPNNEQCCMAVPKNNIGRCSRGSKGWYGDALARLEFVNKPDSDHASPGTSRRSTCPSCGRLFIRVAKKGQYVNVGWGLPGRSMQTNIWGPVFMRMWLSAWVRALGGMPAMGIFFGASINPENFSALPECSI